MSYSIDQMRHYAEMCAECARSARMPSREQFLLDNGVFFDEWEMPRVTYPAGTCYHSAYLYASQRGLLYCEGIAAGIIPTGHAWCVDAQSGVVVDPTWWALHKGEQPVYLGVCMTPEDALAVFCKGDPPMYSLFEGDYKLAHDIVTGKFTLRFAEVE